MEKQYLSLDNDDIFALSTPDLTSAICVFRLSGKNVINKIQNLVNKPVTKKDKIYYREFIDPSSKELIDKGIMFFKNAPNSFTGEDMVEIQLHGSRAVISKMNNVLSNIDGIRQAQKGEFTRRAFMNGKMDILQAESLGDLIHANTDYQRRMALEGLDGNFSSFIENIREDIFTMISLASAMIDFADDEVPPEVFNQIYNKLNKTKEKIDNFISRSCLISEVKEGMKVAIIGAPNAGKSSFINAILDRDALIVSDQEGTTRDSVSFTLDIKGYPVKFIDTAGLRKTDDPIEKQGIIRTMQVADDADIILFLQDPSQCLSDFFTKLPEEKIIFIYTKSDLVEDKIINNKISGNYFTTSSKTKKNLDLILEFCAEYFKYHFDKKSHFSLSQQRYMKHLGSISSSLISAKNHIENDDFFLFSEELSIALGAIEEMTCKIDFETILGDIFSKFCIGK